MKIWNIGLSTKNRELSPMIFVNQLEKISWNACGIHYLIIIMPRKDWFVSCFFEELRNPEFFVDSLLPNIGRHGVKMAILRLFISVYIVLLVRKKFRAWITLFPFFNMILSRKFVHKLYYNTELSTKLKSLSIVAI